MQHARKRSHFVYGGLGVGIIKTSPAPEFPKESVGFGKNLFSSVIFIEHGSPRNHRHKKQDYHDALGKQGHRRYIVPQASINWLQMLLLILRIRRDDISQTIVSKRQSCVKLICP
jgi:hypothetical protein